MKKLFFAALVLFIPFVACDRGHDHDHVDAFGFVLRVGETQIFRQHLNNATGEINLTSGVNSETIEIFFLNEAGTQEFQPTDASKRLVVQSENTAIISVIEPTNEQRWRFQLRGEQVGTTRVRFVVNHGNHSDYVSPWVNASVLENSSAAN